MANVKRWTTVNVSLTAQSREEAIDMAMVEADIVDENIVDVTADHIRTLWVVEFTIEPQPEPEATEMVSADKVRPGQVIKAMGSRWVITQSYGHVERGLSIIHLRASKENTASVTEHFTCTPQTLIERVIGA